MFGAGPNGPMPALLIGEAATPDGGFGAVRLDSDLAAVIDHPPAVALLDEEAGCGHARERRTGH